MFISCRGAERLHREDRAFEIQMKEFIQILAPHTDKRSRGDFKDMRAFCDKNQINVCLKSW